MLGIHGKVSTRRIQRHLDHLPHPNRSRLMSKSAQFCLPPPPESNQKAGALELISRPPKVRGPHVGYLRKGLVETNPETPRSLSYPRPFSTYVQKRTFACCTRVKQERGCSRVKISAPEGPRASCWVFTERSRRDESRDTSITCLPSTVRDPEKGSVYPESRLC